MDNLPAHKVAAANAAIRERGAWLLFLPPYSPDLNPIELAFSKLKAHMKRLAARTVDTLWKGVGEILERSGANFFAASDMDKLNRKCRSPGCNRANVVHKPRLATTARPISPAIWLNGSRTTVWITFGAHRMQTQGKIERWHQTLKNRILLENYYLPGDLENQISAFVDHYNNQRYHESIGNVTPADAYFGRHTAIIEKRKRIKKLTTQNRRLDHQRQAA